MSMPSSGVMVSVKLRRSAGSGKLVTIVEGRSSSVRSFRNGSATSQAQKLDTVHTFLHSNLGGAGLWLPLCCRLLVLLHAPYLFKDISSLEDMNHGSATLTLIMVCGEDKIESMRGSTARVSREVLQGLYVSIPESCFPSSISMFSGPTRSTLQTCLQNVSRYYPSYVL